MRKNRHDILKTTADWMERKVTGRASLAVLEENERRVAALEAAIEANAAEYHARYLVERAARMELHRRYGVAAEGATPAELKRWAGSRCVESTVREPRIFRHPRRAS